jgi:predicted S18 family serine protease
MTNSFRAATLTYAQISTITARTYYWITATKDGMALVTQTKRLYARGRSPAVISKAMQAQARLLYPHQLLNWDGVINNIITGKYDAEVGLHLARREQQDF